ncbi:uncharacterized protein LOC130764569 [Actinidia eriantha]|uniref:uncharacterized protein LOC130764569 n=1 Tax=Actinidia eriantha TaxID=165200 RepID=UPI00258D10F4|nr:uncharacterized protein LOC130764569 [Actinidia eriantha]
MVMEALQEDMGGEASTQCSNHPFTTAAPGGICAFCLQEKLDKLVSSSVPTAIFPSSSSSPSPSFRSDFGAPKSPTHLLPHCPTPRFQAEQVHHRGPPRRAVHGGGSGQPPEERFLVVLHIYKHIHLSKHNNTRIIDNHSKDEVPANGSFPAKKREEFAAVDQSESPDVAAVGRKVSRSRSVGCGSRSFSGDFFERISTGFGDCTLRRVESQREGKHKTAPLHHRRRDGGGGEEYIKERVKCGGIFGGFMVISSSSSSSSSSCLMSSSGEDSNVHGRPAAAAVGGLAHVRCKSWAWAFASPIRALSKPTNSSVKKEDNSNTTTTTTTTTPNLNAIPSLLAVRG